MYNTVKIQVYTLMRMLRTKETFTILRLLITIFTHKQLPYHFYLSHVSGNSQEVLAQKVTSQVSND